MTKTIRLSAVLWFLLFVALANAQSRFSVGGSIGYAKPHFSVLGDAVADDA